ncbi:taste receptor type 1 member 1, partial [Oxyura jamaicensis]|uniref:taste receptor type 1 member 1 n=1 Tax=Oxyura jamaicensis TaxID=8884 RepID=UPI0015A70946
GACLGAASAFFSRDGDYRLAGLFQLHGLAPRATARPLVDACDDAAAFKSHGYHLFQAMRFTLEEINNSSTLLPNITLGYDIYDTCSESANIYATLRALIQKGRQDIEMLQTLQHYEPKAVAVIGPDSTQLALTTAAILGVFLVPEISYEASLETLSLKHFYPSFLRTIPSDGQQVKAIALLLQSFKWTWVALLGSDNAYGRDGLDALYELLVASDVCVAYRGIIPKNKDASSLELHKLVGILMDIRVNVTVVFSNVNSARPFFEVVVQKNITGMVWVASEDWSLAQNIWQVPGIQSIGSVIGMSVEQAESTMLERLESWKYAEESAVSESAGSTGAGGENRSSSSERTWLNCTQQCPGCHLLAAAPNTYDAQASNNVYSAVYAVAHGLHDLLGCASGVCSKDRVYPWQLLQKIKQVNFSLHNSQICFDANGNIHKGYDIIMWNWRGLSWAFDVVGTFTVNPDRLLLNRSKILWRTKDHQVLFCIHILFIVYRQANYIPALVLGHFPITGQTEGQMEAVCGEGSGDAFLAVPFILPENYLRSPKPCPTWQQTSGKSFGELLGKEPSLLLQAQRHLRGRSGTRGEGGSSRQPGLRGTVRSGCSTRAGHLPGPAVCTAAQLLSGRMSPPDLYACQACGEDEWSPARSEACFNRTVEFLSWAEPLSWALLTAIALLLLLVAALAALFARHASTPVVRAAGGRLCFLMLGALACACGSLLCYFGEPTRPACLLRLPLFAVSFAVFLSSVATRCLRLVAIFKLRGRCPPLRRVCLRQGAPALFVAASAAAQAALCLAAALADP